MMAGTKVTIKGHQVSIFNDLSGVILGMVPESYYSWRVLIFSQIPKQCGPLFFIDDNKNRMRCSACGWQFTLGPDKIPRYNHYWFDPKAIGQFVIEVNEKNLIVN